MGKKPKEITVIADAYVVLQSRKRSGERINWQKELRIYNDMRLSQTRPLCFWEEKAEFERRLYDACGFLTRFERIYGPASRIYTPSSSGMNTG